MTSEELEFDKKGFLLDSNTINSEEITDAKLNLADIELAGKRSLLREDWCLCLARKIQARLSRLLPGINSLEPVQCTIFQKTIGSNWLVPWHQDRSLPTTCAATQRYLTKTRIKEDIELYQPNSQTLDEVISVRVHLDPCLDENGPLQIIPGTHKLGCLTSESIASYREEKEKLAILCDKGAALIMKPLLIHKSSKSKSPTPRRVLHFVYANVPSRDV